MTSRPAVPTHLGPGPGFRTSELQLWVERARGWLRRPSGGRGRAAESPPPARGGEGERAGAPRGARSAAGWGQVAGPPLARPSMGSRRQDPRPRLSRQPLSRCPATGVGTTTHVELHQVQTLVNCTTPAASADTDWTWARVHVLTGPQFPLFVQSDFRPLKERDGDLLPLWSFSFWCVMVIGRKPSDLLVHTPWGAISLLGIGCL